jgi:hypothetical protein
MTTVDLFCLGWFGLMLAGSIFLRRVFGDGRGK